jgi:hypothetical protein
VATPLGMQQQQRSQVNLNLNVAANTAGPAPIPLQPPQPATLPLHPQPASGPPTECIPVSAVAAGSLHHHLQQPQPAVLGGSQPGAVAAARLSAANNLGKVVMAAGHPSSQPLVLARSSPAFSGHVATAASSGRGNAATAPPQQQQQQQQAAQSSSTPAVSSGPPPGIPPLTDVQKKIVAEFKAKIANLPPERQQTYIAQNKMNLIRRLNFQPSQLQILQCGRSQLLPLAVATSQIRPPPAAGLAETLSVVVPRQPPPPLLSQQGGHGVGAAVPPKAAPRLLPLPPVLPPEPIIVQQQKATEAAVPVVKVMVLPPPPPPPLPPPISKAKKIAWVESQVKKDQQEAINPNYTTPFRGREDACKRLLRYHVFEVQITNLLFVMHFIKQSRCCAFHFQELSHQMD